MKKSERKIGVGGVVGVVVGGVGVVGEAVGNNVFVGVGCAVVDGWAKMPTAALELEAGGE